jgi:hypothetical protein
VDPFLAPLSEIEPLTRIDGAVRNAYAALKRGDNQDQWTDKCEVRLGP